MTLWRDRKRNQSEHHLRNLGKKEPKKRHTSVRWFDEAFHPC